MSYKHRGKTARTKYLQFTKTHNFSLNIVTNGIHIIVSYNLYAIRTKENLHVPENTKENEQRKLNHYSLFVRSKHTL